MVPKTVLNNTGADWTSFELELQVILGTASGQGDGLSFADGSQLVNSFTSDKFAGYTRLDVTRDYLNFSKGLVKVGETVTFNFVISDNGNNNPFYLLQSANLQDIRSRPPGRCSPEAWRSWPAGCVNGKQGSLRADR